MWFNGIIAFVLRSPLHGLLSHNTMLVTVRGRKTGRPVTTPVNYVRSDGDLLVISLRSRTWWRNLRGRETPLELRLAGRDRSASGSVDETPAAVEAGLAELVTRVRSLARPLRIGLEDGRLSQADLAQAAKERVIVRIRLAD